MVRRTALASQLGVSDGNYVLDTYRGGTRKVVFLMAAPRELERITVDEALDRYFASLDRAVQTGDLSPATVENYRRDITEFRQMVGGDKILDDITGEELDELVVQYGSKPDHRYKNPAGRTRSPGATARFRQSFSRMFAHATKAGWVQLNPVLDMTIRLKGYRKNRNAARTALEQSSAQALLETPVSMTEAARSDQQLGVRDQFILQVLIEVGPRVAELCLADRADITTDDSGVVWFTIRHAKGGKPRRVPLSPKTADLLAEYDRQRPAPRPRTKRVDGEVVETVPVGDAEKALLLTWRGLRMTPRDVQLMVNRRVAQMPAEVRRSVTPHGLRHTAATLLLASGAADVRTVRDLFGHESISTTSIYLDGTDAEMVHAVRSHPVTARTQAST